MVLGTLLMFVMSLGWGGLTAYASPESMSNNNQEVYCGACFAKAASQMYDTPAPTDANDIPGSKVNNAVKADDRSKTE